MWCMRSYNLLGWLLFAVCICCIDAPVHAAPPIVDVALTATPFEQAHINSPVTIDANVHGGEQVQYKFLLAVQNGEEWSLNTIRSYNDTSNCQWFPRVEGPCALMVYVRSANDTAPYELSRVIHYTVAAAPKEQGAVEPNGRIGQADNLSAKYYTETWKSLRGEHEKIDDVAVDGHGDIYMADTSGFLLKYRNDGALIWKKSIAYRPWSVCVDRIGDVYVADGDHKQVMKYSSDGVLHGVVVRGVMNCGAVAVDSQGYIYAAVSGDGVGKFSQNGNLLSRLLGKFGNVQDIAVDQNDNIYVADSVFCSIQVFDTLGRQIGRLGEDKGGADGQLKEPRGVAIDPMGNIWVADTGNARAQKFSPQGSYLTQITGLYYPHGIAVDANGSVYIGDYQSQRFDPVVGVQAPQGK